VTRRLRALVTAGGTRERIDDVRVITNMSTGRFGAAIANALAARGVDVTVLGSHSMLARPDLLDAAVERVPFGSYADLARALDEACQDPPDLLLMAAAVSDYVPVPTDGKLPSSAERITIELTRTAKLLPTLRERCGEGTFLVGFKLLSGVSRQELVAVAARQLLAGQLDMTVANDLQALGETQHPVVLVTPDGEAVDVPGPRQAVARHVVEAVLRGQASRSPEPAPPTACDEEAALLSWGQDAGLRPRDSCERNSGHRWLAQQLPWVANWLETHTALVIPDVTTSGPEEWASLQETVKVHHSTALGALGGAVRGAPFSVRVAGHGHLLACEPGAATRLRGEWEAALAGLEARLKQVGSPAPDDHQAVLVGGRVAGVLARWREPAGCALFLLPRARGAGAGDTLASELDRRGERLLAWDAQDVAYYVERGWRAVEREGQATPLLPPSARDDLRPAASVCVFDPIARQVLLIRRKRAPRADAWAFPGGGVEAGEDSLAAATRELREETGLAWPSGPVLFVEHVTAGSAPDGERAASIDCHVVLTLARPVPQETDEAAGEWVPLADALARRPILAGVRRVLRLVQRRVGVTPA
jgi:phosphopantothenate---cysteine ligase (CTP)